MDSLTCVLIICFYINLLSYTNVSPKLIRLTHRVPTNL